MPSGRKRRNCKCEPGKPCRCACCEPLGLPPLGPPHAKGCPALVTAPPHSLTPKEFGDEIEKATGVRYSKSHLYALLAALRLTPKTPTMTHVNRASRRSVMRWQRRVRKRIDRLRERGYTVVAVDEAFFVHDTRKGRKHWSLVGKRVPQPRTGSHKMGAPRGGGAPAHHPRLLRAAATAAGCRRSKPSAGGGARRRPVKADAPWHAAALPVLHSAAQGPMRPKPVLVACTPQHEDIFRVRN